MNKKVTLSARVKKDRQILREVIGNTGLKGSSHKIANHYQLSPQYLEQLKIERKKKKRGGEIQNKLDLKEADTRPTDLSSLSIR